MIGRETVQDWLRRQPLEPFEVKLSNGESYQVRHPENAALLRGSVLVVHPDSRRYTEVALLHIASIEPIEPSEASTDSE